MLPVMGVPAIDLKEKEYGTQENSRTPQARRHLAH
jgi:hypothetical protein